MKQCQFKQEFSCGGHRRCRCAITQEMCGFVYFCAPDNRYKNTRGFENCVIRQKNLNEKKKTIKEETE